MVLVTKSGLWRVTMTFAGQEEAAAILHGILNVMRIKSSAEIRCP